MEAKKIPTTPNGQPMYNIQMDGNNQEYKIVNFSNPEMVPDKGIKIVRAIKKSSRHQPSSSIRLVREQSTGIIYGIPGGLNDSKDLKFQLIEINDLRQFDLTNIQDRMEWAVISRAPFLKGSPFARGKSSHVLFDVEAEADKKIIEISEKKTAYKVMEGLSEMQCIDMARNVGGIDTRNNSMIVIKSELYEFIDSKEPIKGPKKFNEIWAMSNREAFTVFKRCIHVGLVSFDLNNGWLWKKSSQLGTSEPMAIEYITKNPSLLMSMDNESKSIDDKFTAFATPEEKEKNITAMPVKVDSNILKEHNEAMARVKLKEDKLDELLAKAEKITAVDLTSEIKTDVGEGVSSGADQSEEAKALRKLQDIARKDHGMKNAYLVKDPEILNKWIADHPIIPESQTSN